MTSTTTRLVLTLSLLVLAAGWPLAALPCGGGFGDGLNLDPSQKIVLVHRGGVESYIFSPHFCGKAAEFGLILPVPDKLSANPDLAERALFTELEALTAPVIVKETRCGSPYPGHGADAGASWGGDGRGGVTVIDRGQVGIFDWVLIKADTSAAFTDWLDTNKYPHDKTAIDHFTYYVNKGWYFVAFKVTADTKAPPAGMDLCGDLGPIRLSFASATPVIPARIAAVAGSGYWHFGWRVFTIAAKQQRSLSTEATPLLRFSGTLTAASLGGSPQLAKLATAGDRLTKLDLEFWGGNITSDLTLGDDPQQADFRQTITQITWVPCDGGIVVADSGKPVLDDAGQPVHKVADGGGCSISAGSAAASSLALLVLGLSLLGLALRRPRR